MNTVIIRKILFGEVICHDIELTQLFDEISLQIDKLEMNNYRPKILIIYYPLLNAIMGISSPEIRRNYQTEQMEIMGLKVIPIDYEIENYVKVY